mmetsp:Transcript_3949/g.9310  ORF Transcript_3949/g.9310 Transcript_3949/m.9310 type:complete len:207 (+) Transcript_3949:471-1091(+)
MPRRGPAAPTPRHGEGLHKSSEAGEPGDRAGASAQPARSRRSGRRGAGDPGRSTLPPACAGRSTRGPGPGTAAGSGRSGAGTAPAPRRGPGAGGDPPGPGRVAGCAPEPPPGAPRQAPTAPVALHPRCIGKRWSATWLQMKPETGLQPAPSSSNAARRRPDTGKTVCPCNILRGCTLCSTCPNSRPTAAQSSTLPTPPPAPDTAGC